MELENNLLDKLLTIVFIFGKIYHFKKFTEVILLRTYKSSYLKSQTFSGTHDAIINGGLQRLDFVAF